MAAACARMMDRTGNRIDFTALLGGQTRGDQRTAGRTRLDHQHAQRKAADDAVAARKVARLWRAVQRQFGHQRTAMFDDLLGQAEMALRIQPFDAGAEHRDGLAVCIQRTLMCSAVDSQRQSTGDDETRAGQAAGKSAGIVQAVSRGAAAADYRQLRPFEQGRIAGDEQQRRGIRQLRQQGGIGRIVPADHMSTWGLQPGQGGTGPLANLAAAARFGAADRQTQGTPGAGRRAEGRRGIGERTEQPLQAPRTEFRQQMKTQPGFKLGGGNGRHGRHSLSPGTASLRCYRSMKKPRIRGAFLVQGLRTLSFTDSERVACSTRP